MSRSQGKLTKQRVSSEVKYMCPIQDLTKSNILRMANSIYIVQQQLYYRYVCNATIVLNLHTTGIRFDDQYCIVSCIQYLIPQLLMKMLAEMTYASQYTGVQPYLLASTMRSEDILNQICLVRPRA